MRTGFRGRNAVRHGAPLQGYPVGPLDPRGYPAAVSRTAKLQHMGRALRHRNYRLFFLGQGTSLIGTWISRVAVSWLVYRLTGSELLLGTVSFAGQIPTFLLAPIAGVWVERWSRHRVMVVTQALLFLHAALLAIFTLTGLISVPLLLVLAAMQGFVNAFDTPARQAFVVEMVEAREDLANAIALNSMMVNGARLVGPSAAGILIALVGEGWCFAIDAVSYVFVLGSLLAMRLAPRAQRFVRASFLADLRGGFGYVARSPPIRAILTLLAIVSLTSMPYTTLMPVFATEVLGGGPNTLGFLTASIGVGAICGALWLAARPSVLGLGRVMLTAAFTFGAGLVAFSLSRSVWLSAPLLAVAGAGMMLQMASCNTLLQTLVDEDMRARVMSFYTMAFFGMAPFGSLLGGWLGATLGAPAAVALGGCVTIATTIFFATRYPQLRKHARPIYERLGILRPIANGLNDAAELPTPPET